MLRNVMSCEGMGRVRAQAQRHPRPAPRAMARAMWHTAWRAAAPRRCWTSSRSGRPGVGMACRGESSRRSAAGRAPGGGRLGALRLVGVGFYAAVLPDDQQERAARGQCALYAEIWGFDAVELGCGPWRMTTGSIAPVGDSVK